MKQMKNIRILLVALVILFYSCSEQNGSQSYIGDLCGDGEQGFVVNTTGDSFNGNVHFNGDDVIVQYVTGHPDGDYYHIFNTTNSPLMDFYTFAIATGSTSTFGQNFNVLDGTYLAMDGSTFPLNNSYVLTTTQGGAQPGDLINIEFSGLSEFHEEPFTLEGRLCVTIDEVVSVANYVYITDGSSLKVVNVSNVLSPSLETTIAAPTSYYVNTANSVAYVGHFDAIEPFVSFVNIANPPTASIYGSVAKGATYGRLTDVVKVEDYTYLSDEYRGFHKFHMSSADYNIVDGHDTMSMVKNGDDLVIIDMASALHKIDVTDASAPIITNTYSTYTDVDTSSYPFSNGSFHSWTRTDGTNYYVANIIDKKLKKFQETGFGYNLVGEAVIDGHATALAINGSFAFITMKPSPDAPLQTSFDGIKMVNLNTMTVVDSKPLAQASGVVVNLNYAYVTDANGLHIYDISSGSLNHLSTFTGGFGNYIAINN